MEIRLQQKLIDYILSPLSEIVHHISPQKRKILFITSGTMIFFVHFFYTYIRAFEVVSFRFLYVFVVDCLMCGIMLLISLPQEIHPVHFDKILLFSGIGVGFFAFVAGITKDSDHLSTAVLCLVVYPAFYLIWNNCNYDNIIRLLIQICRYSFVAFLAIHISFFPITHRKYGGFFNNPNGLALYLVLVFCCLFLELLLEKKQLFGTMMLLVLFGICTALLYYTNSRTGQLAAALTAGLTIFLLIFTEKKSFRKVLVQKILPMLISVVIFIPSTVYIFQIPPVLKSHISAAVESLNSKKDNDLALPNESALPHITDVPEYVQPAPTYVQPAPAEVLQEIQNVNDTKFSINGRDLARYSSGRIDIWKGHLQHITFWGHSNKDHFEYEILGTPTTSGSAHMTYLQYGYKFGALSGVLLLIFNVFLGIKSVFFSVKTENFCYKVAPFSIAISYGVVAVLASISSFSCMLPFFYYLWQCPLMIKSKNNAA